LPQLPDEVSQLVRPFTHRLAEACTDLPVQLTHGDCNDGNVLVASEGAVGFIDIDHLPSGPRIRDLAYYLASRLHRHLDSPDTAPRATAALSAVLSCYLAGYHRAYPLTPHEVSAVVPLMLLVEIGGAHWSLHGWEPNVDRYRRNLNSISWLTAQFDDLVRSAVHAHERPARRSPGQRGP
jgi:Ser/Thr protein kinase RdoA (MazF antagonist)